MEEEKHYGLVNGNPLKWIQFKGWFFLDLPAFVKQNGFIKGAELGAKAGRSMFFMLRKNKSLHLIGIDLWQAINAGAYYKNDKNYKKCKRKLSSFKNRVELQKGDAADLASNYKNNEFDFVHYDLQTASLNTPESHTRILSQWIKKIREGGVVVGRDFRNSEIRLALNELGYTESDIKQCQINNRTSLRMEYIVIKHN